MNATNPVVRTTTTTNDTDDVLGSSRAHMFMPVWTTLRHLVSTEPLTHVTIARLTLGLVMLPHALQKSLGWFGGLGFTGTYQDFVSHGLQGALVVLLIVSELLGSLALIFGALTRVGAIAIMMIMFGAIGTSHAPHGFFMNWTGANAGEGFEYHLLAIGLGLVTLIAGGGRFSIDRVIMQWRPANGGSISPVIMNE